jgi:threonine/homoserine/homoserine lactone efflux protein
MKSSVGFVREAAVKHFLFALVLVVVILVALRVLFWALTNVLILAAAAVIIYIGVRVLLGRRGHARNPKP